MSPASDSERGILPGWAGWLLCAFLVAFASVVRTQTALQDANFGSAPVEGLLKSDPGLLYYFTQRVAEADGLLPEDFRADPRVQHPRATDVPAEFTVGQELLVGWLYRVVGGDGPLHLFTLRVMAVSAALALVGVYALALASTASVGWALLATLLAAFLPANYRTIGFLLVREDLAFPFFALHLGTLALAARDLRASWCLVSGLALAVALATWHATSFLLALELACIFLWFLRTGRNPLSRSAAWAVAVPPLVACLLVPALRAQGVAFSAATLLFWSLALGALLARGGGRGLRGARGTALIGLLVLGLALVVAGRGAAAGYAHVYEVLLAKLRLLGRFPHEDPTAISFDARLLWQGPFATLHVPWFLGLHSWALLPAAAGLWLAARAWRAPGSDPCLALLGLGFVAGGLAAWAFERLQIVPGLLAPVLAIAFLSRLRGGRLAAFLVVSVLVLQGGVFAGFVRRHVNFWYQPSCRQAEIAALVDWVRSELEPGEPVLGDFMNSTALLAHVGTPIVLQPKYETADSRRRAEAFLTTFFHRTPAELAALARERFGVRYVLVDRFTLWELSRETAGLPASAASPAAATAASFFLSSDDATLRAVPGFTLVYRSPASIECVGGEPSDFFRVYRVE